ncbi:hypothetical protein CCY99_03495 [Helicobacter sp. 16-1353]|uniref:hypothetical protein n=1 Tax=Helicobacter sp. 16-1353 TaxID=2004996 RepID=UPI000DCAE7F0|nr:hypothetical protein [Helicobacter sp. 16-1353]RAX54427.1 hypothetical protein CCY99_03495 [Helicobacter sp. 16-1353]
MIPKRLNKEQFVNQFKNPKGDNIIKTPVGELKINPQYAFSHLRRVKNGKLENRKFLNGGILPTLLNPLFVTKNAERTLFFYKPFTNENGKIINLVSVEVSDGNILNYKTSYHGSHNRVMNMIKND